MPEPKQPCPHCSRLVGIHRGLSLHYAHRPSCFLAEKSSIRNSQTSQSNLPNLSNDVADTISSPDPLLPNATRPNLDNDVNEYAADIDFDSDSNAAVSSSIGNVGSGEPRANEFQSIPGLGTWILMRSRQFLDLRPWMLIATVRSVIRQSPVWSISTTLTKSVVMVQQDSQKMKVRRSIS